MAWFTRHPGLAPEVRLLVITGFLGGLTTFSTFSAEVADLLLRGQYLWGLGAAAAHLVGSLAMTVAGIALVHWLLARG
jgi:CrcB protein